MVPKTTPITSSQKDIKIEELKIRVYIKIITLGYNFRISI